MLDLFYASEGSTGLQTTRVKFKIERNKMLYVESIAKESEFYRF